MGEVSKRIVSKHTAERAAQSIMAAIDIAQKALQKISSIKTIYENKHTYHIRCL